MTKIERMGDTPLVTQCYATLVWPNVWEYVSLTNLDLNWNLKWDLAFQKNWKTLGKSNSETLVWLKYT
jgi:hypothetical protein